MPARSVRRIVKRMVIAAPSEPPEPLLAKAKACGVDSTLKSVTSIRGDFLITARVLAKLGRLDPSWQAKLPAGKPSTSDELNEIVFHERGITNEELLARLAPYAARVSRGAITGSRTASLESIELMEEAGVVTASHEAGAVAAVDLEMNTASRSRHPTMTIPVRSSFMATITRPAALIRQGSLRLYATSIRVADLNLPNFYTIDRLDPEEAGPGYQRILNQGRAKRLTDYLLDGQTVGDAFLPTSIFLATNKDIPFDAAMNTITFDVGVVGPFNVVDGQHRIAGLIGAADKNPDLLQFEIPVNIAVCLDDVSQMCHFLIVNTTQRSVDKAVEQQIVARLTKMVELEHMPTIPRWIQRQVEKGEDARALLVANHLNADPNSAWAGKIRMANDANANDATINQQSFVNSLKRYVFSSNNPLSNPEWDEKRPAILSNYWKAVVELLVDEQSPKPSIIFKTSGVDLFHIVSATVFTHLANQRDFKKETIKKLLLRGFGNLNGDNIGISDREWWQRGGVASGLNSAAVRRLATALNHAIHVQDNIGTIAL